MPRDRALTVLHVLDHSLPHHSGYSFRTRNLIAGQRELGWRTFHLTGPKQGGMQTEEESGGLHFFRTPQALPGPAPLQAMVLMSALQKRLLEVARMVRPDVLQVHSPVLNALPALRVAAWLGVPLVYEVRAFWEDAAVDHGHTREGSLRYRLSRSLETLALKRAQHVTTICEGLAAEIRARGLPGHKITLIPNAVDVAAFRPGAPADPALKAALGLAGKTVFGFVGSFYAYEGLMMLIEAFERVRQLAPPVALLLVGGGPQEPALRERVAQRGLQQSVIFTGRVGHDAVARHYDLIDLLVYPRLPMRLTELVTPIKPLEAMAQGRRLLASDVGGHRELVQHGRTGSLFKAGSCEALAEAMLAFMRRPGDGHEQARAARRFVETERTWRHSVARYQPVFESLCLR